jgi:hypothetical protein
MKPSVVLGLAALLASFAPAYAQSTPSTASASASLKPAKPYRVVDLKMGSFVIDKPGNYVLTRSWTFQDPGVAPVIIDVVAADVTLDFRGFEIDVTGVGGGGPLVTVVRVQGDNFTLKNAGVFLCCEGGAALRSSGRRTVIEDSSLGSIEEAIELDGDDAIIRDSRLGSRVRLASESTVERTFIACRIGCVSMTGNDNRLLNSTLVADELDAVSIAGDGNLVANNLIEFADAGPQLDAAFDVLGDKNVLRDNTLFSGGDTIAAFRVSGTANVLDGNIATLASEFGSIATGIRFLHDGNLYGDNRMQATVPFDLGATTQTNWGGNVGY